MKLWTYAELKAKLERELDIEDEDFIDDRDLMAYVNEAIDKAEQIVHTVHKGYFKTYDQPTLTPGASFIAMPDDVYGNSVLEMVYSHGGSGYEVKRILHKEVPFVTPNEDYRYDVTFSSAVGGVRMNIYPSIRLGEAGTITRWYIRNANRVDDDDSIIDIPEGHNYVFAYVRKKVAEKDVGHPNLGIWAEELDSEESALRAVLSSMAPDGEAIQADYSHYYEHN